MNIGDSLSMLRALSQETRLEIFRLLVKAGLDGMAAGEIARRLGAPQNTISTHLSTLEDAGLLRSKRAGRSIAYAADLRSMGDLIQFLVEDCCQGLPEIGCSTLPGSPETPRFTGSSSARA
ncbi:helix-turn-helix transcriptional regulator [Inquilinus sp. Marseille-Q2685]|uniref:ArsR/SmtB family transcription factor n=1 Tax=Inquilinus sp. Marseille-Q2685 TaxID=2866581 RepID=UPI001CE3F107|nr:metalloregulator ArsR/SmtB family transcription factor [Inquilinus sp. Marseille-Q2685]